MVTANQNEQRLITDLVAELAIALNDKAILESENATLKLECQELKHRLSDYERITNEERSRFTKEVKKSQEKIYEKEISLAQKDVQHLQQQKKFLVEINDLKAELYKQKELFGKTEIKFTKELELLRAKTLSCSSCSSHKEMAESFQSKYLKYKAKLKYAIGIINTLTAALEKCKQKPSLTNKESQTESRNQRYELGLTDGPLRNHSLTTKRCEYQGCRSLCSIHSQYATYNENNIVADLFFKPHPSSNEIETIFFMPSHNTSDSCQESDC